MVNKVILVGNLGADPELSYTPSGTAVAKMSVATSERWKDSNGEKQERTEWHRVVVWGKLAEICGEYLRKGYTCYFEGKNQTRKWEDRDGVTRHTTEVVCYSMQIIKGDRQQGQQGQPRQQPGGQYGGYEEPDDDIPF